MKLHFSLTIFLCFLIFVGAYSQQIQSQEAEADTLLAHEDYQGALELYTRIIETGKTQADYHSLLLYKRAVCQYSLQYFEKALQDVNAFLLQTPDSHRAELLKAFIGRELGAPKVQVEALNALLSLDSSDVELLRWRASALLELGKYIQARKDIFELRKSIHDPELDLFMGIAFYYDDNPDSAMVYFDDAIQLDKNLTTAYMYAGSLSIDQQAYDLALKYLNKGIVLDPENFSMIFYKGMALTEQGKFAEGCSCLLKAFNGGIDDAGDYLKQYCYGVED